MSTRGYQNTKQAIHNNREFNTQQSELEEIN
jgi:hypothetical protein